jgi:hypothetical protein
LGEERRTGVGKGGGRGKGREMTQTLYAHMNKIKNKIIIKKIRERHSEDRGIVCRSEQRVSRNFFSDFPTALGSIYAFITVPVRRYPWKRCCVSTSNSTAFISF